ncbi:substrate-binding periplasmic protein [Chitinimonas sp. PSY-7]|uniref:transporter substrate-binding domain-containing protein n=1 Tax=Chitinimonas sp. PSY-7 TaxID=3459088 RepID=UPI00404031E5
MAAVISHAAPDPVTFILTTEDSPPYNMVVNENVAGIATDKVRELMKRAGLRYRLDLLPWKRAYEMALAQKVTCVFSTTRTPDRETLFKWIGPLASTEWVLYGKADRKLHLSTLEDAYPYVIGTYNGDIRDTYLRGKNFKVDTAPDENLNPAKLMADRIDLWASGRYEGGTLLVRQGLTRKVVPVLTFNRANLYLACNKQTPDELIHQLQESLNTIIKDGTAAKIDRQYDPKPQH